MATDMSKAIMTPDGWRREKQGNHIYRPKWVDFQGRAIHQLTLVTTGRKPSLGSLVIPNNDPEKAYIKRTPIGQMVAEEIERMGQPFRKDPEGDQVHAFRGEGEPAEEIRGEEPVRSGGGDRGHAGHCRRVPQRRPGRDHGAGYRV